MNRGDSDSAGAGPRRCLNMYVGRCGLFYGPGFSGENH